MSLSVSAGSELEDPLFLIGYPMSVPKAYINKNFKIKSNEQSAYTNQYRERAPR
jgi:hypothetical protein